VRQIEEISFAEWILLFVDLFAVTWNLWTRNFWIAAGNTGAVVFDLTEFDLKFSLLLSMPYRGCPA